MGTSTSSNGPCGGISFDPPWLISDEGNADIPISGADQPELPLAPLPLQFDDTAPRARYAPARKALNCFISSGDSRDLKRALGAYSRRGMGGAARLARRMTMSAHKGAVAVAFFRDIANGEINENSSWLQELLADSSSTIDVFDKIAAKISPEIGGIDENSCRDSITQALIDLEVSNQNFDITNFTADDIQSFICHFLSNEIFNRVIIDIGQSFERHLSVQEICERKDEMREYIFYEVEKQVTNCWDENSYISQTDIVNVLKQIIHDTFTIFEEE